MDLAVPMEPVCRHLLGADVCPYPGPVLVAQRCGDQDTFPRSHGGVDSIGDGFGQRCLWQSPVIRPIAHDNRGDFAVIDAISQFQPVAGRPVPRTVSDDIVGRRQFGGAGCALQEAEILELSIGIAEQLVDGQPA